MHRIIVLGFVIALVWGVAAVDRAAAQVRGENNIFGSPSVDYYVNRVRNRDVPNFGLRAQVQRDINRGRPAGGSTYRPTFLQGGGTGGRSSAPVEKPFSNASHRPTVSPYLNLLREDLTDELTPNYHTLVRPQLEQIRFQQNQQRRNETVYRQLQQIQARTAFSPQGSEMMMPTGHVTTFQNLSTYYPGFAARRR